MFYLNYFKNIKWCTFHTKKNNNNLFFFIKRTSDLLNYLTLHPVFCSIEVLFRSIKEINLRYFLYGTGVIWLLSISRISSAAINQVVSIHIWPSSTYTRVTVESDYVLEYKQFFLRNPRRIVVDIKGISLNSVLKNINSQICDNDLYIKSAWAKQFDPRTVRVVFELKQKVKSQLFALSPSEGFKDRLVIDLYMANATNILDPLLMLLEDYKKEEFQCQILPMRKNNLHLDKVKYDRPIIIMLDPGHGGEDFGAIGKFHTREKDVVLQIAHRLKVLIEKERNMRACMTRNEDIFIPLKVRVAKAKQKHADLFVSIHADAFTNRQPKGSSVFALSTKGATSTAAKYLADIQNSSDLIDGVSKSGDRYLDHTMIDMVQSLTINDSLQFGKIVLNKLAKINKLHKNSVEQAGFEVLKALDIPSILVETAFISNIEEERKLKKVKFQQEVAESILEGIKAYFSNKVMLAHRR